MFRPEYIKFILSDEAKVLQKLWKPRVRDVFTMRDGDGALGMVVCASEPFGTVKLWRIDWFWLSPDWGLEWDDSAISETVGGKNDAKVWLPTLWQLVKMIEGTGYRVGFSTDYESATRLEYLYWLSAQCAGLPYVDAKSTDLMLAAAKLAVRAVEG